MAETKEVPARPRPETFREWEERKHRERLENRDSMTNAYVARVEARRETWQAFKEINADLPAVLKAWAEVLGEVPMVRIGPEGITIIPKGVGR